MENNAMLYALCHRPCALRRQVRSNLMVDQTTIPLFPLEVVLMPSMPLPLHIFEKRYKLMIGECLEQNSPFGVVYQKGLEMKKVGCTARIVQVTRRFGDGRLNIMTQGVNRFKIESVSEERPYFQATVIYFEDDSEEKTKDTDKLVKHGIELLKQWDLLTGKTRDYGEITALDHTTISFLFSHTDGFSADEKQEFLELTSTNKRIRKSVESLRKMVELKQATEEFKRIVGGNGNLRSK